MADRNETKPDWWQRVTSLASIGTVAVAIAALLYTNQANREQARLTEQGQITDRFSRATEQLGSDRLDVRLGGLYALKRLMNDSRSDEPAIVDILGAFVRGHTARRSSYHLGDILDPDPFEPRSPTSDVQAAMTVLSQRPDPDRAGAGPIDLSDSVLVLAHLDRAQFNGADMEGSDLLQANLKFAKLHGALLSGAILNAADFSGADLRNAHINYAYMHLTVFTGANLRNAQFAGSKLLFADLRGADLRGADLRGADLTYAQLDGAKLDGVQTDGNTRLPSRP